jgi:hypothetical protein
VDSELDDATRQSVRGHLDGCPTCRAVHHEITSLKRLLETKVARPQLPGGLAGRIFRNLRHDATRSTVGANHRLRRLGTTLAASVAIGLLGWLGYDLVTYDRTLPLAHADLVREIHEQYRALESQPEAATDLLRDGEAGLREKIRRATGIVLGGIPRIAGALLFRFAPTSFAGQRCVRLDYLDEAGTSDAGADADTDAGTREVFSIFVVPVSCVDLPAPLARNPSIVCRCRCVRSGDTVALYCFRDSGLSHNLVAHMGQRDLCARLQRGPGPVTVEEGCY